MSRTYLRLLLLLWFPGALHGEVPSQGCHAPRLNDGYFIPVQESYPEESSLSYACDGGFKPVGEEWWATSTCVNGMWTPEPQCIDETACLPPTVANRNPLGPRGGWYRDGAELSIGCDEGYELGAPSASAMCRNGTWSPVPVCRRSSRACGAPPEIPHAVIILQKYQELFPTNSELHYECEDGYTLEGVNNKTSIKCRDGSWTEAPTCTTFCYLDTHLYPELMPVGVQRIKGGDVMKLECVWRSSWRTPRYSDAQCTDGTPTLSRCRN
ncbi:complement factor H-related protein 2-like [Antennarius striatus]|uniref:complement factor H-related protein 2-like n=1 Tax=Antennarius striatus TaxID=241820 RepID=UPI0035ADF2EA